MSIFSWLSSKPEPTSSSGLPAEPAKATARKSVPESTPADPLTDLKQQRHERRDQLYDVVRSVMLRSEVMPSHYKFKVLSLDARGRQFLVMIDLLGDQILSPDRWLPVELLMAMTAAQRHDLQVKAVYWRLQLPQAGQVATSAASFSPPVVNEPVSAKVAAADGGRDFEPIDDDELIAFQRAMSGEMSDEKVATPSGRVVTSGPRKPASQPDYEDTQLLDPDDPASPLSHTQFGGLG